MKPSALAIMIFVIGPTLTADAVQFQCPTIPAAVEQVRPRPFVSARISEMMVVPTEQAIKQADLIVVGALTQPKVYLSTDECTLYTDFVLATRRVVSSNIPARDRPGSAPIVIRTWGGETMIAGVPVKIYEENLRPLVVGRSYLLFLSFNEDIGKYEIYGHGAYALEVATGDRLKPAVKAQGLMDATLDNARLDDALKFIEEHRAR